MTSRRIQLRSSLYLWAPAEPTPVVVSSDVWYSPPGPRRSGHGRTTTPPRVTREGHERTLLNSFPLSRDLSLSVLPPPPTDLSLFFSSPRPRECSCSSLLLPSPALPQIRARFPIPGPRDARGHSSPKAAGEQASFRRRGPPGGNLSWSRLPPRLLSRRGAEA